MATWAPHWGNLVGCIDNPPIRQLLNGNNVGNSLEFSRGWKLLLKSWPHHHYPMVLANQFPDINEVLMKLAVHLIVCRKAVKGQKDRVVSV
jgi:hypothetical protein